MREALVRRIRGHRPHVVISFDPNGMNGHPDHVAIARFTIDAVAAAADPRWMDASGRPYRVPRLLWTAPVPPWEVTRPRDLGREPGVDFVIDMAGAAGGEGGRAAGRIARSRSRSIAASSASRTSTES